MTGMTQGSWSQGWKKGTQRLSWDVCGRVLWNRKGLLLLIVCYAWAALLASPLPCDPAASRLTAAQLRDCLLAQTKPLVFGAGLFIGTVLLAVMLPWWRQWLRALGVVMLTTLAFWGGVAATTYAYTYVIAEDSTIVLSQPKTMQERIPR